MPSLREEQAAKVQDRVETTELISSMYSGASSASLMLFSVAQPYAVHAAVTLVA